MVFGLGRMTLTSLGTTVTTDQVEWAPAGVRWAHLLENWKCWPWGH